MSKAVILLSGGLDSATAAAVAKNDGHELFTLTIDYGQRHRIEIEAAKKIAKHLNVKQHIIMPIDLRLFGGSSLTDDIDVPKDMPIENIGRSVPNTYVPARNTIFLSLALAYAETVDAESVYIGISCVDFSAYPDCRPEFLDAFNRLAPLATNSGFAAPKIVAPLLFMSKKDTILLGRKLGIDYSQTFTCYDPLPDSLPCGRCESCILREKAFSEADSEPGTNVSEQNRHR